MSHYIEYCRECGGIISQCRCMALNKEIKHGICPKCRYHSENEQSDPADAISRDADREMIGDDVDFGLEDIGNK